VLFYAVLLLIFSRLWVVVFERTGIEGAQATDLLWYLALTEWIVLSVPTFHLDIEADIRSGDIATRLPQPISYLGARMSEAVGGWFVRAVSLGIAGVVLVLIFGGAWPSDPRGLLLALPLGVLGATLGILMIAAVGLSAFWVLDASPLYWIWQKAAFILGGLMLPLQFYPAWLRELAEWTPFAAMLNGPGRMALAFDPALAAQIALQALAWIALTSALLWWTYRRGLRVLNVGGG
jgi:ABC-2 type transport system permease protein